MKTFRGLSEALTGLVRPTPWLDPPGSASTIAFLREAFGEDLSPREAVARIIKAVHDDGDDALREFTHRFDGVELSELEVTKEEIARAYDQVDTDVIDALHMAAEEIEAFHKQ